MRRMLAKARAVIPGEQRSRHPKVWVSSNLASYHQSTAALSVRQIPATLMDREIATGTSEHLSSRTSRNERKTALPSPLMTLQ
tara:strand:+ start:3685 stop:3933 length:249 start_codon:yes stop_codon:yes gene_type:complete